MRVDPNHPWMKNPGSWVIKNRQTGDAVCELFNPELVKRLNTVKYEAVPIYQHLVSLNEH